MPVHEESFCWGNGGRGQDGQFGGVAKTEMRGEGVGKNENEDEGENDECIVKIGAHVRLPVVMDQELLDWIASVVKASKVMDMEVESRWMDEEIRGLRDLVGVFKGGVRDVIYHISLFTSFSSLLFFSPFPNQEKTQTNTPTSKLTGSKRNEKISPHYRDK